MDNKAETIAALATGAGAGGIAIVRISGPKAWLVGRKLFEPSLGPSGDQPPVRRLLHGYIQDPANGERIDEVLCVFYKAPNSYTTEDTVEIQGHAGSAVARKVLNLALAQGCRMAEAGEFTMRAFLGGRLDLAQAEAVAQLVDAQSDQESRLAMGALQGGLTLQLSGIRECLLRTAAAVEACLDFPEDAPFLNLDQHKEELQASVIQKIREILKIRKQRRVFREGGVVVLCGRPNVGKSSLFNAMLGQGRAIVTDRPGTTRDAIEESIKCRGVVLRLVDTAGLGISQDEIEKLGMVQTKQRLGTAHIALVVLDGSSPINRDDLAVLKETEGLKRIIAINKSDKEPCWEQKSLDLKGEDIIRVSAKEQKGLEDIIAALDNALTKGMPEPQPGDVVASERQSLALAGCLDDVSKAEKELGAGEPRFELISVDLGRALEYLGQVDGQSAPNEVIDAVFQDFCVGK